MTLKMMMMMKNGTCQQKRAPHSAAAMFLRHVKRSSQGVPLGTNGFLTLIESEEG
jgi:hypothetical protein